MLERILSYLRDFYIEFQQPGAVILDPVMLSSLIISVNDLHWDKKSLRTIALHLLIFWPILVLLKGMRYQTLFLVTNCHLIVTLAYTLIFGRKHLQANMVYFMVIWAGYYYSSSFSKALAGIIIENVLGFELTTMMVQLFMILMLFLYFSSVTVLFKRLSLHGYSKLSKVGITFVALVLALSVGAKNYLVDTLVDNNEIITIAMLDSRQFIFYAGILLYALVFLSYYYCFTSTKNLYESQRMRSEISHIIDCNNELESQQKTLQQNIEEMRYIRHDIKNQMAYLQIMLAQKDYGQLEKYLAAYTQNISPHVAMPDCENTVVRNILILEQSRATQNHLVIDSKVALTENPPVSSTDLTAILINLLDNAIEACVSDGIDSGIIELSIRQSDYYLYINVSNPLSDRQKYAQRLSLTTFKDRTLHGNGTKIVSHIAAKYNGVFSHEIVDDRFIADVMLALE